MTTAVEVQRQLRWWRYSEEEPELHYWNFLIVNEEREIRDIRQKLRDALTPVDEMYKVSFHRIIEEKVLDAGEVRGHPGLLYELTHLVSTNPNIDFSKVYKGLVVKDRRLRPRKKNAGWNDLIQTAYLGYL